MYETWTKSVVHNNPGMCIKKVAFKEFDFMAGSIISHSQEG